MKSAVLEHARMRYATMTPQQRALRVAKMTHGDKLEAFLWVARENEDVELEAMVKAKMGRGPGPMLEVIGKSVIKEKKERREVRKTTIINDSNRQESELEREITLR